MFKHIKKHIEYKKAKKAVTLMCMNQYLNLLKIQSQREIAEKEAYDTIQSINASLKPEDISTFMENINSITDEIKNPEVSKSIYEKIAATSDSKSAISQ